MNIYVYFQSHDLFNSNATYLDNSIGHFIKMCMDSHLQHHELEEIPLNWFAVKHCLTIGTSYKEIFFYQYEEI